MGVESAVRTRQYARIARVISALTILVGCLVLIGWLFDIPALKSILPRFVTMKANTALAFILTGAALWILSSGTPKSRIQRFLRLIAYAAASIVLLTGLITLSEYVFGADLGIDQLLFREAKTTAAASFPGRMAPVTAFNFILIGAAFLLINAKAKPIFALSRFFIFLLGIISFSACLGYIYGVPALYGFLPYTSVALHTAVAFFAVFIGALCARPDQGIMVVLASDTSGGILLRRAMPAAVFALVFLGWARLLGQRLGFYEIEMGIALLVTATVSVIMIVAFTTSKALFSIDKIRVHQEEEFRKLHTAVEQSPAATIITDRDGDITYVNPKFTWMTGYSLSEIKGKNPKFLKSGEQPLEFYRDMWQTTTTGREWRGEFHNKRKDGELYWAFASISPIVDREGKIVNFVGVEEDITERKRLERALQAANERLRRLDRIKDEFVATVSHELRTPMSIVQESISQVVEGMHGNITPEQRHFLSLSLENITRLGKIINNLLDISKIETGKVELKREQVDMAGLARGVISDYNSRARAKALEIKAELPQEGVSLYIDRDKIVEVFSNLINNAVKFTEKGSITVSVVDKKSCVECSVQDTGIGIEGADMDKVFGKFEQFGSLPGPGEKGTGLGLSISKGIVELHSGKIWVESKAGEGSKFTFSLPRRTPQEIFMKYITKEEGYSKAKGSKICLVIVSIAEFEKLKSEFGAEKFGSILKGVENALKKAVRRAGDVVEKDTGELAVLLVDCGKETALRVEGRLEEALEEYLSRERLSGKVKLRFELEAYPEDAKSYEELIKKVKKT